MVSPALLYTSAQKLAIAYVKDFYCMGIMGLAVTLVQDIEMVLLRARFLIEKTVALA